MTKTAFAACINVKPFMYSAIQNAWQTYKKRHPSYYGLGVTIVSRLEILLISRFPTPDSRLPIQWD
ncbi:hypothetical protein [Moorena producens]|uniref:hypothetical protein n=1 Tax=Moorena producens TaxID=1155739 RepID=UPI0011EA66E5|nr:hypothetical protein [Moorena producens]